MVALVCNVFILLADTLQKGHHIVFCVSPPHASNKGSTAVRKYNKDIINFHDLMPATSFFSGAVNYRWLFLVHLKKKKKQFFKDTLHLNVGVRTKELPPAE